LNEDGTRARKRWSYTVVHKGLRQQRKSADVEHAARVRSQYKTVEAFAGRFSYRKGNKQIHFTSTSSIARQFRKINNKLRLWDRIAEEEEELEEIDPL
jgi:hypothetical protein